MFYKGCIPVPDTLSHMLAALMASRGSATSISFLRGVGVMGKDVLFSAGGFRRKSNGGWMALH